MDVGSEWQNSDLQETTKALFTLGPDLRKEKGVRGLGDSAPAEMTACHAAGDPSSSVVSMFCCHTVPNSKFLVETVQIHGKMCAIPAPGHASHENWAAKDWPGHRGHYSPLKHVACPHEGL